MKSNIIAVALILGSSSQLWSGDYGKASIPDKNPYIEECYDLGGEISSGYMTDYILHGLRVNRDSVWTDVNYTFDALVPLNVGVTHLSGIGTMFPYNAIGPIDETAVYAVASFENVLGFSADLGYKHRFLHFTNLPGVDGSYGEIALDLRRDLGLVDFVIGSKLGLNSRNSFFAAGGGDGWTHYAGLEKSFGICEAVDLVLAGGVGYHDGYYFDLPPGTSDWSHYYINASLPIELNCRATISPYIGYNGVQQWGVFFPQGDALHGGVSVNVQF